MVVSEDPAQDENVLALRADMKAMVDASSALTGGDFGPISSFVAKLGQVGQAGDKAIDLIIAKVKGEQDKVNSLTSELNRTVSALEAGKLVSERSMVYFIKDALAYQIEPKAGFEVSASLVQKGAEVTFTNTSSTSAAEYKWSFPGATKAASNEAEPTVVYTKPGRYDVTLTVRNRFGEDTVSKKSVVYVVESMPEKMDNLALKKHATASSSAASTERAEKAVDGLVTGSKWCATGNSGQWLTIDLQDTYTLSSFRIHHAEAGGEGASANTHSFTISVSTDGRNYTKVVDVDNNTKGVTEHAITPTAGRYVKLDIRRAVSPGTQWPAARIFEFEAYGITGDVSQLPEYVAPDTAALEALLKEVSGLAEADYTTATWGKLVESRDSATELLARGDKTQDEVDAARAALAAARDALVNVAELKAALEKYANLNEADYTGDSWAAFQAARDEAQALIDGAGASQDQVADAVKKLDAAAAGLQPKPVEFSVTFDDCWPDTQNIVVSVPKDGKVARPADPTHEGWKFEGWFTDTEFKNAYDFETPVTGDLVLYAKWAKVSVPGGGSDEPVKPADPQKPGSNDGLAQTGDLSMIAALGASLAGVAAIGIGGASKRRR